MGTLVHTLSKRSEEEKADAEKVSKTNMEFEKQLAELDKKSKSESGEKIAEFADAVRTLKNSFETMRTEIARINEENRLSATTNLLAARAKNIKELLSQNHNIYSGTVKSSSEKKSSKTDKSRKNAKPEDDDE